MVDTQTQALQNSSSSNTPVDWAAEREANYKYTKKIQQIDVAKFIVSTIATAAANEIASDNDRTDYTKAMNFLLAVLAE